MSEASGITWEEAIRLSPGTIVRDVRSGAKGEVELPSMAGGLHVAWTDLVWCKDLGDYLASTEWDLLDSAGLIPLEVVA